MVKHDEYRSEYFRAGVAEGEAEAVVIILESAGLSLTAEDRARITDCTDLDQLDAWLGRVALVNSVSELFDGPAPR
jgi:hypothetical protein